MAFGLPFSAVETVEMCAVPCKGPAVVEGPDDWYARPPEEFEQQGPVQIVPMQVVQTDHIGLYMLQPAQEALGCVAGAQTVRIQCKRVDTVCRVIQEIRDLIRLGWSWLSFPPESCPRPVAAFPRNGCDTLHDATGTPRVVDRVDLNQIHTQGRTINSHSLCEPRGLPSLSQGPQTTGFKKFQSDAGWLQMGYRFRRESAHTGTVVIVCHQVP